MQAKGLGKQILVRWLSFNGVGVMGVGVQLTMLTLLIKVAGMHYLGATAIAQAGRSAARWSGSRGFIC